MISPHLAQLERTLRGAVAGRRYPEVARTATEFTEAVRAYAQTLPQGDSRAAEAGRRLGEGLSWALVMMQAARSGCIAELRRVTAADRYSRRYSESGRVGAVQLDA
jgi:hypothetical protein